MTEEFLFMERERPEKRWVLAEQPPEEEVERLRGQLKKDGRPFSEVLTRILLQRGIGSDKVRSFFLPSLEQLHDPFSMKDMDRAVERLTEAVFGGQRIMVLGDYDVDGTTAVAMVDGLLRSMGQEPLLHIPDRYDEGYGVSRKAVERAQREGVDLLLTLDCGIKGVGSLSSAREKGIDVIVCDHHRPGEALPPAYAVLDPQRDDELYPFGGLSGCGVAFKLFQAFFIQQELPFDKLEQELDLLAISIAADIVPMEDENRILTHFGLRRIEEDPRPGIKALKERAGIGERPLDVDDLVFTFGPRINAAGRMDSGLRAVELLTAGHERAIGDSSILDGHNRERRSLDQKISKEALERIRSEASEKEAFTTVVHDPEWHKGVIGIVASRLMDHYHRPTIVLTGSGDEVTGSARSVKGFDIHQAILNCSEHLERFGGHCYAAGLTLKEEALPAFKEAFEKEVARTISPELMVPEFEADAELELKRIDARFFRTLQRFGPFGPGNLKPIFLSRDLRAESVKGVGKDKAHLKLRVHQAQDPGSRFPVIAFGLGHHYPRILSGEPFHILYHVEMNEFRGQRSIQLRILDIKFGEGKEALSHPSEKEATLS